MQVEAGSEPNYTIRNKHFLSYVIHIELALEANYQGSLPKTSDYTVRGELYSKYSICTYKCKSSGSAPWSLPGTHEGKAGFDHYAFS